MVRATSKKKVFKISASWEMYGFAEIEASSEQEAIDVANTAFFNDQPTLDMFDGHYVDESFQIDYDVLEDIREKHMPTHSEEMQDDLEPIDRDNN